MELQFIQVAGLLEVEYKRGAKYTIRSVVVGTVLCVLLSATNQVLWYHTHPISITPMVAQVGIMMFVKALNWIFDTRFLSSADLAVVFLMANAACIVPEILDVIVVQRLFYGMPLDFMMVLALAYSTLGIGVCIAKVFDDVQITSPWRSNWTTHVLLRVYDRGEPSSSWHDAEYFSAPVPPLPSRMNAVLVIAFVISVGWHLAPSWWLPAISSIAVMCFALPQYMFYFAPKGGLGLLTWSVEWNGLNNYLGNPLLVPLEHAFWVYFGYVLVAVTGAILFALGQIKPSEDPNAPYQASFNITNMLGSNFKMRDDVFFNPPSVGFFVQASYGANFFMVGALVAWSFTSAKSLARCVNTKLSVWYSSLFLTSMTVALVLCQVWNQGCSWVCVVLSSSFAWVLAVPVARIKAETSLTLDVSLFGEAIQGFIHAGDPMTSIIFKQYNQGAITAAVGVWEGINLSRAMRMDMDLAFWLFVLATCISTMTYCVYGYVVVALSSQLCLSESWNCTNSRLFYAKSVLWGVLGPRNFMPSYGVWVLIAAFSVAFMLALWMHRNSTKLIMLASKVSIMPLATSSMFNSWITIACIRLLFTSNVQIKYSLLLSIGFFLGALVVGIIASCLSNPFASLKFITDVCSA